VNSPAIGICAAVERVRWGPWSETVTMTTRAYATAVQAASATALLLPPDQSAVSAPEPLLERIDALLVSGGSDIDPSLYGQSRHSETGPGWPDRDAFEVAMTGAALERRMPVLGACRGMQVLNVARGGTLIQHLPDVVGNDEHRHTPGAFADHEVRLSPGSLAARVEGAERAVVKSHHHQGVDTLGEGLVASGWAIPDGVVEAIELDEGEHPFALGVLWHPEEDERSRVVAALVEAARGVWAGAA
jgi:putative glutamine amidotransferase